MVCQAPSPRRKVELLAVPLPSLAVGTAPLERFEALRDVRFAPLTAGNVAGKRASGTVPLARFDAFNDVNEAPLPLKVVAVTVPPTCNKLDGVVVPSPTFPRPSIDREFLKMRLSPCCLVVEL